MKICQGDTVLVATRTRVPYTAVVEWVDRSFSGNAVKVKVRPIPGGGCRGYIARHVAAKTILEVVERGQE
jgi:hypothetical protein